MVVDDDEDVREVAKMLLEGIGYPVTTAASAREAFQQIEVGEAPSLILLDMVMSGMDGEQFLRKLRASSRATIPVVVMSGHSASCARAQELGANGCLTKPIELDELLLSVKRFAGDPASRR
jgi:CheY-like chemotaxis protein